MYLIVEPGDSWLQKGPEHQTARMLPTLSAATWRLVNGVAELSRIVGGVNAPSGRRLPTITWYSVVEIFSCHITITVPPGVIAPTSPVALRLSLENALGFIQPTADA